MTRQSHRSGNPSSPVARLARHGWRLGVACLLPLASCYSTREVSGAPKAGAVVLLDLNDRARIDLGERIGPSAERIEGTLQSYSDSVYVVRISSVSYLGGRTNKWSGEQFAVPTALVARTRVREFSRSRTTLVGAGIVGAIVALFLSTDFLTSPGIDKEPGPGTGGET